jgi:hypothetical protein
MSIVLMIVGAALAIPTFIAGLAPIIRAVRSPIRFEVPGEARMHLAHGDYLLYEDKGATSFGSAFSPDDTVTIQPQNVSVTAPDGSSILVLDRGSFAESLTVNGRRYVSAARFTAPSTGEYVVRVTGATFGHALVARPLASVARKSVGWFLLAGLGAVLFVVGIVLLIVGAVRRGRPQVPAYAAYAATPPGWHPDPWGTGRWRYWDGSRWTEHVQ